MHFYARIKQKFVYIYLFVLARRFYRFLKIFPNVGYDILERGYRYIYKYLYLGKNGQENEIIFSQKFIYDEYVIFYIFTSICCIH